MTQPTDKYRETARQLVGCFTLECGPRLAPRIPEGTLTGLRANIATALANLEADAYARGRGEAEVQVGVEMRLRAAAAELYDLLPLDVYERVIKRLADAILASSPGPSLDTDSKDKKQENSD